MQRLVLELEPFHCCLSVVLRPEEGDFPGNLHCVVYVNINKRSFESFMCLDLVLELNAGSPRDEQAL